MFKSSIGLMREVPMPLNDLDDNRQPLPAATMPAARALLVVLCLAAGLAYRVIVGVFPASVWQAALLAGLAALFLLLAVLVKRTAQLRPYGELPFAFFVFTLAGLAGDQGSWLQQGLVHHVLHETPTAS